MDLEPSEPSSILPNLSSATVEEDVDYGGEEGFEISTQGVLVKRKEFLGVEVSPQQ